LRHPALAVDVAAHAFFLAESQPFLDGNKRAAALALTVFLNQNDFELVEFEETALADRLI
jgi:death-on-curing protein